MTAAPPPRDKPALPKRFYKTVSTTPDETGSVPAYLLLLDERSVKTPGKTVLALPTQALAEAAAEEWRAQGEHIDPATMPLNRIVNSALDGVRGRENEVRDDIAAYAGSDLLCYRAEAPADLVALQAEFWDPLLDWAAQALPARFVLAQGVMPVNQPPRALEAVRSALTGVEALPLAALHVMTTLTGSAILPLAHTHGAIDADKAWQAAHVDEDYQISEWGEDAEAAERRRKRWLEFQAAASVWALARSP